MKNKHASHASSIFTSIPCIIVTGVFTFIAALYGTPMVFSLLSALFLLALFSRVWAWISGKGLKAEIRTRGRNLFSGESMDIDIEIRNEKFFPNAWMDLIMPLPKKLSIVTEETRKPDQGEVIPLLAGHFSTELIGIKRLGSMRPFEEMKISVPLHAERRGVCDLSSWTLRTGDGIGVSESEIRIENGGIIVVYPALLEVNTAPFLKNLWNADTGSRGVMEDVSVIRSTRDYQRGDSIKHVNWRMLARSLPLSVNVYEDILPKSIHLIFDGESFSGPSYHLNEMEEMISIIASELVELKHHGVRCFLSICSGATGKARCIIPKDGIDEALYALSLYEPLEEKLNEAGLEVVAQPSEFELTSISKSRSGVGHFFYFAYDSASLPETIANMIPEDNLTLISYIDTRDKRSQRHMSVEKLRRREK